MLVTLCLYSLQTYLEIYFKFRILKILSQKYKLIFRSYKSFSHFYKAQHISLEVSCSGLSFASSNFSPAQVVNGFEERRPSFPRCNDYTIRSASKPAGRIDRDSSSLRWSRDARKRATPRPWKLGLSADYQTAGSTIAISPSDVLSETLSTALSFPPPASRRATGIARGSFATSVPPCAERIRRK